MNQTRRIGWIASWILAGMVAFFFCSMAASLFFRANPETCGQLSYVACIFLAWSYVTVAACSAQCSPPERRGAAEAAKLFAVLYAAFVTLVYYTQITAVRQRLFPDELRGLFDFQFLGSWMFGLDLLGYGIMALSTFFWGLSMAPQGKAGRGLKRLALLHGIFVVSAATPVLGVFTDTGASSLLGTVLLMGWCVYFCPVAVLSALRFRKEAQ